MTGAPTTTFEQIENSPLNARQKGLIFAAVVGTMLEFFDFFIIAFILSIIVEPWGLTFGESSFVLLTGGVGAVLGSFAFGALADWYGRRTIFQATVLTFALATGALALVPDGSWLLFGLLRFVVGFGVGGLVVVDVPLVQEFVPSRKRGFLGGLVVLFIPIGIMLGSISASFLGPHIGWRGLVLLGLAPALLSLYIRLMVPESPRWLIQKGRLEEAKRSIGWMMRIPAESVRLPDLSGERSPRWTEMFRFPRSVLFTWINSFALQLPLYGLALWGPTLLALQLDVTPQRAAMFFIAVSFAGFVGRLVCSVAADRYGRRYTGFVAMAGGAVALVAAGAWHDAEIGSVSMFFVMLVVAYLFCDGAFAVALPYWSEMFPTDLRTSGVGAAYGFGGIGKILGPAGLVFISGAGTVVTPQATVSAIPGAFLYFAVFALIGAVSYLVLGLETRRKTLGEIDSMLRERSGVVSHRAPAVDSPLSRST